VIPFPAGGGADIIARALAAKLGERLKQPFVIENLPGAGGILGTQKVAAAAPDGYTYVMGITNTFAINRTFYKQISYDPIANFQPVAMLAVSPHILVINPDTPAKNVQEFVEYVKKNKGKLSYASYGNGSTTHLISEMFNEQNGTDLVHIPYKGMPPALTDVMGNRIAMLASSAAPAIPLVQGKKLRAIGIYGDRRISALPDVPTMPELGYKDSALTLWYGFFAPAGTPRAIVERMNAELKAIMADKEMEETYTKAGIYAQPMTVDEFTAFVRAEGDRWGRLVTLSGARAD
jgi:tripartite-type tricarboxylate transporter receptor subunit TctC